MLLKLLLNPAKNLKHRSPHLPHNASQSLFNEKRRHPRLERNIHVKISCEHGDILTETKNLSCSGAFCRMNQRLEPMTKLKVQWFLPLRKNNKVATKRISCEGVIVRVQAVQDGYYDTAIFFSTIAPKDSRTIHEYIESMMEKRKNGKFN